MNESLSPKDRLYVALDTADLNLARGLVQTLRDKVGGFKVGKEFFTHHGPQGVRRVVADAPLFLDLKFHDIPNTVAAAVRAAIALRPHLITVHVLGGRAMLQAARKVCEEESRSLGLPRPLLIGVTMLTSLLESDLRDIGITGTMEDSVLRLARLAHECGLDGVVASGLELSVLRRAFGNDLRYVVPGLRPIWTARDDQRRSLSPEDALASGADYLVIGRPITRAPDPLVTAERIIQDIS